MADELTINSPRCASPSDAPEGLICDDCAEDLRQTEGEPDDGPEDWYGVSMDMLAGDALGR